MENVGQFVARQSPWKMALIALGGLALIAAFFWIVAFAENMPPIGLILGWVGLPFFGLGTFIAAKRIFNKKPEIIIDAAGIRYARWSSQTILWNDITEFFEFSIQQQKMIGINLADPAKYPGVGIMGKLASANKALSGADISVVLTGLDKSAAEITEALQRYSK